MIAHLDGVHETVDYRKDTSLRFYDNTDYEEYPVHWHTCVEIIMPVKGDYRLTINGTQTVLQPDDILIVCPGVLHTSTPVRESATFCRLNSPSCIPPPPSAPPFP